MTFLRAAATAVAFAAAPAASSAEVVRLEILKVEPTGPRHERITGRVHGELDPRDPKNALITDIDRAPTNARGKVEYIATFAMVKPADMASASGVLVYTVVNRGNGNVLAHRDGHVTLVSGWQGDVEPTDANHTIRVPVARNADGSSITGPLRLRLTNLSGHTAALTIPRNQPSPYPPASLDTRHATLVASAAESPTGETSDAVAIASSDWAFADCSSVPFPGRPDPTRLCTRNGFDPAKLYELRYTVKDPLVLGIGLAATRDIGSFFRYETQDAAATPNPIARRITHAIAEGSSQSGTFLRLSLLLGFNEDEGGRRVWDGMHPHIAARLTDLNRRFAFPGGLVWPGELGHEGAVWWTPYADKARNRPAASLLDRCTTTRTCPKIAETFGSAEMWGLRQSFTLVGTDAAADVPLPDNVRRYYFASVSHGGGPGGFDSSPPAIANAVCALSSNPAPVAPMRAAIFERLIAWVVRDQDMPASSYPRLADGTLVINTAAAMGYPAIPGRPSPEGLQYPLVDYDLGPEFHYRDQSGILTALPQVKRTLPQLVVRVDADGNEAAGIRSPLVMAPLGTYTGWNVSTRGVNQGQICMTGSPVGGFIPFATTRSERMQSGDPRLSLEERYGDHANYVKAVAAAANTLVGQGYLMPEDAEAMKQQAARSAVLE